RLADRLADDEVAHHRCRGLADRAALALPAELGDRAVGQPHAQGHLVAAGRVDVVHLGVERLGQPAVVRVLVVIEDDLLVHALHRGGHANTSRTLLTPRTSASTSSVVVYTP